MDLQDLQVCLHLADELTAESVDDTSDRGLLALADEVKVKHALDGLGLHAAEGIVSAGILWLLQR